MIGLDASIPVRYLISDDEQQWQQAATIIQQSQPCFHIYLWLRNETFNLGKSFYMK
jgi:predicted nucleic-acid-binding protein